MQEDTQLNEYAALDHVMHDLSDIKIKDNPGKSSLFSQPPVVVWQNLVILH